MIRLDKLRFLVFLDGSYQDSVYLIGFLDWYEGYFGGLICYLILSNLVVIFIWYNGFIVFSFDIFVFVIKRVGFNVLKFLNQG